MTLSSELRTSSKNPIQESSQRPQRKNCVFYLSNTLFNIFLVSPRTWNASLNNMTIPVGENLELALKCWKTYNQEDQSECHNDFSILRYV